MKSRALQELVKKIFSDEKIKSQFMTNPDSILSQFSLTEDERKAVLKTHARLGQMDSDSVLLDTAIEPNIWWT